jgi:hypothetical protein
VSCFSGPALGFDWEQGSSDAPIQNDPNPLTLTLKLVPVIFFYISHQLNINN